MHQADAVHSADAVQPAVAAHPSDALNPAGVINIITEMFTLLLLPLRYFYLIKVILIANSNI